VARRAAAHRIADRTRRRRLSDGLRDPPLLPRGPVPRSGRARRLVARPRENSPIRLRLLVDLRPLLPEPVAPLRLRDAHGRPRALAVREREAVPPVLTCESPPPQSLGPRWHRGCTSSSSKGATMRRSLLASIFLAGLVTLASARPALGAVRVSVSVFHQTLAPY